MPSLLRAGNETSLLRLGGETARDRAQLRRRVNEWIEEEKQRACREYHEGVPAGTQCPAQPRDSYHRLGLHMVSKKQKALWLSECAREKLPQQSSYTPERYQT